MTNNSHHNHPKSIHHHLTPPSSTITHVNHQHHHRHLTPPSSAISTTRSNSTTQACAACRYQRRKCAPDCILAPYFPHDRQKQFQNAHRLFGVRNITKIIQDLDQPRKDDAMQTIIWQSDAREKDPVGGCYRIVCNLEYQVACACAELDRVRNHLEFYRRHAAQNQNHHNQDPILIDDMHLVNNPDDYHHHRHHSLDLDHDQMPQQQQHQDHHQDQDHEHEQFMLGQLDLNDHDDEDDHVVPLQEINSWATIQTSPPSSANCLEIINPHGGDDQCGDFKPLLINDIPPGDRPHFKFEFDETNEPSEETIYNEENQKGLIKEENVSFFTKEEENNVGYQQNNNNEDHDLKGAATLFTLTNCTAYS